MGIVIELEGFWSVLTERGVVVLLLQVLLMAVAAVTAALIHRRSHKVLTQSLAH